jgi:hypothetical protein
MHKAFLQVLDLYKKFTNPVHIVELPIITFLHIIANGFLLYAGKKIQSYDHCTGVTDPEIFFNDLISYRTTRNKLYLTSNNIHAFWFIANSNFVGHYKTTKIFE